MQIFETDVTIGERKISFEIGRYASYANAAVIARMGDTMVLATVVASKNKSTLNYFPLMVEYAERLYAGGKIKGSRWVKREGRPTDEAILSARLIDRSIRPLFPKDYQHDIQIIVTLLSVDGENDPDVLSINAVSAALSVSDIPWKGPIGAVKVGMVEQKVSEDPFIVNPLVSEQDFSKMDLVVASSKEKVLMIEGAFDQAGEAETLSAILLAKKESDKIIAAINELAVKKGQKKQLYEKKELDKDLLGKIEKLYGKKIEELVSEKVNKDYRVYLSQLVDTIVSENEGISKDITTNIVDMLFDRNVRRMIVKGIRPDRRKSDQIRDIAMQVGMLPRTHGSAVFQRGETQALSIATLASPSLEQLIESAQGEETKRYMHHYNMPPYSVGETGRMGYPSRREVGHGSLAERALIPVIPSEEVFPYTIRVVSEILSSNGSTSMASVCGSTLALMDAGVPIKSPVAGISIGLVKEEGKEVLLTDIIGLEDFCGDMDFKVAGTKTGITAIQLDVKNDGLTNDIISKSLEKAKTARLNILDLMHKVLSIPRSQISKFAPKVVVLKVPAEKLGMVIGAGGKVIRKITSETGVTIDINDEDESVTISGINLLMVEKAKSWVEGLTREIKVGETFEGEVKRLLNFGAFVEIYPGKEGLIHVSKLSQKFIKSPSEVVAIGDKVKVKVIEVDEHDRVNLALLNQSSGDFNKN